MQPNIGLNLRRSLFEQINEESLIGIQDSIMDSFNIWLPFIEVRDIQIFTNTNDSSVGTNEVRLKILFNIIKDPDTLESVTMDFESNI